jgi:hypothetical protein
MEYEGLTYFIIDFFRENYNADHFLVNLIKLALLYYFCYS